MNLSVNLNKVCLLRNSRGATNPSPRVAAEAAIAAGAQGLTLHWREDERHTRAQDVRDTLTLARERLARSDGPYDTSDSLEVLIPLPGPFNGPDADLRLPLAELDEVLDAHLEAGAGLFRGIRHSGAFDADSAEAPMAPRVTPG